MARIASVSGKGKNRKAATSGTRQHQQSVKLAMLELIERVVALAVQQSLQDEIVTLLRHVRRVAGAT